MEDLLFYSENSQLAKELESLIYETDILNSRKNSQDIDSQLQNFQNKINFCSKTTNFYETETSKNNRLICLADLNKAIDDNLQAELLVIPCLPQIIEMIAINIFRPLKPLTKSRKIIESEEFELETSTDPTWPQMLPVYESLFKLITSRSIQAKDLKKSIDKKFIRSFLDLFESENCSERDHLKMTLHRMYIKLICRRKLIRNYLNDLLLSVIHEDKLICGTSDLLEFLASVVSGFTTPLHIEHVDTFQRVVLPLHKSIYFKNFQKPLSQCVIFYISKDRVLSVSLVRTVLRFGPISDSKKEVLFLSELVNIGEYLGRLEVLEPILVRLFKRIARCLCCFHAQVCDRATVLFFVPFFRTALIKYRQLSLQFILPAVKLALERMWNRNIKMVLVRVVGVLEDIFGVGCFEGNSILDFEFLSFLEQGKHFGVERKIKEQIWDSFGIDLFVNCPDFIFPILPYENIKEE